MLKAPVIFATPDLESTAQLSSRIRRPTQERSRQRFEDILNAAERLLERDEHSNIGIYAIAAEATIPPASVYHFFAEMPLVFTALAERYLEKFGGLATLDVSPIARSWQDVDAALFERARSFYNRSRPARQVLLGSGLWMGSAERHISFNRELAMKVIEQFEAAFVVPHVPDLLDRVTEILVLNDALWVLSYLRHGDITDDMAEQARRARVAYARTFLPEFLPRRDAAENIDRNDNAGPNASI